MPSAAVALALDAAAHDAAAAGAPVSPHSACGSNSGWASGGEHDEHMGMDGMEGGEEEEEEPDSRLYTRIKSRVSNGTRHCGAWRCRHAVANPRRYIFPWYKQGRTLAA